jgi:hypothetical protein
MEVEERLKPKADKMKIFCMAKQEKNEPDEFEQTDKMDSGLV